MGIRKCIDYGVVPTWKVVLVIELPTDEPFTLTSTVTGPQASVAYGAVKFTT
jgi:hypothetical protein